MSTREAIPLTPEIRARIGSVAVRVWLTLLQRRDANGVTHASLKGIVRLLKKEHQTATNEHAIRRALARLKMLGLVKDIGWVQEDEVEMYYRKVEGELDGESVHLPKQVADTVQKAHARGGRREGAGRPRNQTARHTERFESPEGAERFDSEQPGTAGEIIKPPALREEKEENLEGLSLFPSETESAAGRRLPVVEDEDGQLLDGGGRPAPVRASEWARLPVFPGLSVVQPACVPSPPKVPAEASEDERVRLLMDAYNLTCSRLLPDEWNPYRSKEPKPSERKLVVACAEALREHDLSPLRWCEFSFDVWRVGRTSDKGSKRTLRPSLQMVFSSKRVGEHFEWVRTDYESRGGRVVLTRSLRHLLSRWQTMQAEVLRGVPVEQAVARHFPDDAYDRLVAKATDEARREQQRINTSLKNGEYLW